MAGVFDNRGDVTVSNQQPAAPTVVVGNTEGSGIFAGDAVASISTSTGTTPGGGGIRLSDLSIGPEGAPITDGALAYDNTTGVFTYFPADLTGYLQGLPSDVTLYPAALARVDSVPNELVLTSQQLDLRRGTTVIDSVDLSSLAGGSGVAVQDNTVAEGSAIATLNFGTNLDVTVSGSGASQIATINGMGGGPNPIPQERFNISLSPSSLVQGSSTTTVTATVSVNSPFVLTGFNSAQAHSASTSATVSPTSRAGLTGQSSTFTFDVNPTTAETWNASAVLTSQDSSGVAQPNHTVSATLHVNAPWYADALTTAPASVSAMTSRGVYRSGVSYTFPALANGRAYIALPSSVSNPVFRSGFPFLTATSSPLGSGFNLYTLSIDDYDGSGTLTVEVTS